LRHQQGAPTHGRSPGGCYFRSAAASQPLLGVSREMGRRADRGMRMSKHERLFLARLSLAPVAGLLLLTTFLIGSAASAITYTVIDLATLAQGATVVVRGPNGAGNAVGGGRVAGARRGLIFTRGGLFPGNGLAGRGYMTAVGFH